MQVTGKCHCGKIQYTAKVDPNNVMLCHCTDCQVMSGSAYRISARINVADFVLKSRTPKIYIKMADSGNKRVQAFCGDCGSPLYAEGVDKPAVRSLRVMGLDQRAQLPPKQQIWCQSALPWSSTLSTILPKFPRGETK